MLRLRFSLSQMIGTDDVNFTGDQVIRDISGVPDGVLLNIRGLGCKGIAKLREFAP